MGQLFNGFGGMIPDPNFALQNLQNQISRMQSSAPSVQLNRVKSVDDVNAFLMAPNSQGAFFKEDDDIMWIKSTDANNQASIRRFRFYEEEEVVPQYVTVDDLRKFKEELKEEIINAQQFVRKYNESVDKSLRSGEGFFGASPLIFIWRR